MAGTRTEPRPERDRQFPIGHHVVCIVDILGQTEKLRNWAESPPYGSPQAEFIDALRKTSGTVLALCDIFNNYLSQFSDTSRSEDLMACLTVEQRKTLERIQDNRLCTQQFGDTFLFYASLANNYGDITMVPMYGMLAACGMVMTLGLASHVPLRGAISVGLGMEIDDGKFYGPALADVHHIESKVAEYPRIVVSDQAIEFAKADFRFSANPPIEQIREIEQLNQQTGKLCRALMHKDTDGQMIVNFMGEPMRELALSTRETFPVKEAYQFVQAERNRFVAAGDKKHADRYRRLLGYMAARLPLWGLSPENIGDGA